MERRKALAAASAATLVLGSTIVAAASVTGASFLGFGGTSRHSAGSLATIAAHPAKQRVVVRTRDMYDRFVVDTGTAGAAGAAGTGPATPPGPGAPALPTTTVTASPTVSDPTPTTAAPARRTTPEPASSDVAPGASETPPSVPSAAPGSTTTVPPTTTTTLPRGVPDDWPPGKPIPPMPPNCHQPQLELNGVWNCQSDN
jgi:hypothetical protein